MIKTIVLDGKKFTLDTDKAEEVGALTPLVQHTIGGRYKLSLTGTEEYMLVMASYYLVAMVSLRDGNRWSNAKKVKVEDNAISAEDFAKVAASNTFIKIN